MRNANTALNTLPIGDQTIIKLFTQMDPAQNVSGPYNYRYPFTPPAVKPPTRNFCASKKTNVIGNADNTAAAAKSPHK